MKSALPFSIALLATSAMATTSFVGCSGAPADSQAADTDEALTSSSASSELLAWSQIALDAVYMDATPSTANGTPANEEAGPPRASRALAIVHIAIYDAVQSIAGVYNPYTDMPINSKASMSAAIAQAAHDTLSAMFPSQSDSFDSALATDLSHITASTKAAGVARGALAASNILALRSNDGAQAPDPSYAQMNLPTGPGNWAPDVLSKSPAALGGYWANCTPFTMETTDQFRAPEPPALGSAAYEKDYQDAKSYGGDGVTTPTKRTTDETHIGIFWGYDGAPKIGTPPRLYNLIALTIAKNEGLDNQPTELSRVLALVNTSMADAAMAAWDSKYFYNRWRPDNAIRATDDPTWMALGAMESNTTNPDFTPPFPAYPSGHATFGGALFQTMRNLFGEASFTFVSDEYNGVTTDSHGNVRPYLPRTFKTFDAAEKENARSRIYLGVHWQHDADAGVAMGNAVANNVFDSYFTPRANKPRVAPPTPTVAAK
jgi:hypothetical protein